ncbi:MAG: aminoacyl-tRNA hydrolase, partial [Clostridiales bacterium]|nr:aminoacyl-tRNA hydrolase [Clostridiales bacterium]
PSGSAGSHNGLKSVVSMLNNQNFLRVRVGIGKPPENWDLVNYVLGKFNEDEQKDFCKVVQNAKDAVKCIINSDINSAMNVFNKRS